MVPKPSLLLEVEAALDAAEKAKAELEAFDGADPELTFRVQGHRAILQALRELLLPPPGSPLGYVTMPLRVQHHIVQAISCQEFKLAPIEALWNEREALAAKAYEAGRAYTDVSLKWDSSAERLDYLMASAPSAQE